MITNTKVETREYLNAHVSITYPDNLSVITCEELCQNVFDRGAKKPGRLIQLGVPSCIISMCGGMQAYVDHLFKHEGEDNAS